ncbi:MAG TPA: hypothetical protein VHG70_08250 [Nocardioidaceae bacterium]|nr:hypothetical protein [Nocardioidaceae bacterium]
MSGGGNAELALWTAVLSVLVLLAYAGMLRGWRRRERRHELPPLLPAGRPSGAEPPLLEAEGRYFGSTLAGDWLDRVVARGLGTRSPVRLLLSELGLDVHRPGGGFRIPAEAVQGARHDQGIAGKVVPPHGILVVTWRHGEHRLDTGFRLSDSSTHEQWALAISRLSKEHQA